MHNIWDPGDFCIHGYVFRVLLARIPLCWGPIVVF